MDRLMGLLCLLAFVDTFGYAVVIPLLPFQAERFGASTLAIGAIFGSYSLCQLITAPLMGRWSDRTGRRPLLLVSQLGSAVGFLLMALSGSIWLLALSRIIDGATAGNVSLVYATVMDRYDQSELGWRFSYLSTASGLGIVGGLTVTTLVSGLGLPAASIAALTLALTAMALTWFLLPETGTQRHAHHESLVRAIRNGGSAFHRALSMKFAATVAQTGFVLGFPLFVARLLDYNAREASLLMLSLVAVVTLFQVVLLARLLAGLGAWRAAASGFVLMAAGALITALAGEVAPVAAGAVLVLIGSSLLSPALTVLLAGSTSLEEGTLMGLNQSVASAGQMTGPPLVYAALAMFSTAGLGVACAAWAAGGAAILFAGRDRIGQK